MTVNAGNIDDLVGNSNALTNKLSDDGAAPVFIFQPG